MITQEYSNTQDLLDQFWNDGYPYLEKVQTNQDVNNVLIIFRKSLNSSSTTAGAIDNGFPLDEIIHYAEKDGYHEIAQLLSN